MTTAGEGAPEDMDRLIAEIGLMMEMEARVEEIDTPLNKLIAGKSDELGTIVSLVVPKHINNIHDAMGRPPASEVNPRFTEFKRRIMDWAGSCMNEAYQIGFEDGAKPRPDPEPPV